MGLSKHYDVIFQPVWAFPSTTMSSYSPYGPFQALRCHLTARVGLSKHYDVILELIIWAFPSTTMSSYSPYGLFQALRCHLTRPYGLFQALRCHLERKLELEAFELCTILPPPYLLVTCNCEGISKHMRVHMSDEWRWGNMLYIIWTELHV